MCGISGFSNIENLDINSIQNTLNHRGPDEKSSYKDNQITLIHTRLSIQDIKNGSQPIRIGDFIIIFNGEIYNHERLRVKIKNYTFKTNSDTETFLALFIEYGVNALNFCDGMFAFAIYNKKTSSLFLGRDRIGKKPLYLFQKRSQIFFSSELNAISSHLKLAINNDAISAYLRCGFIYGKYTPFKDVEEVKPGSIIEIDLNNFNRKNKTFFSLEEGYKEKIQLNEIETLNKIDDTLRLSIKDRVLSSEHDVGCFLSGGIDSSLIAAIASEYKTDLKTFTVRMNDGYDESKQARLVSKRYNISHKVLDLKTNLSADIEKILSIYGEPFMDSSAIPTYYISRAAKEHVNVVLNGDGADELFGGYRRYVPIFYKLFLLSSKISPLKDLLPLPSNKMQMYNYFYRLLASAGKSNIDFYLSSTTDIFEDSFIFKDSKILQEMSEFISRVETLEISDLSKYLLLDSELILKNDLLKKMDIASMSHSLEARSPFLSKYFLNLAPSLEDRYKIKKFNTKYILRKLAERYLPYQIYAAPKRGFEVPLNKIINKDLKENVFDLLDRPYYVDSFIERKQINKILNRGFAVPEHKRSKMLWSLYSLEVWYRNLNNTFIENYKSNVELNHPKEALNILQLTTGLGLGGAERVILDICKNIYKEAFKVFVIGISNQRYLESNFIENGYQPKILNMKKSLSGFVKSVRIIHQFCKENKIKIIHAHMFHTLILATILKLFNPDYKIIFTPHNTFSSMPFRRTIIKLLKPLRDVDTVFSSNLLEKFHKKRYVIIPNGVDFNKFSIKKLHKSSNKFTFVMIGRLEIMKNHTRVIEIFKELKDENIELNIVGSGRLESYLKKLVKENNLENKINFLGIQNDISVILQKSDCLLLPSLWEAFPLVLLEAAASHVPIISTNVGSVTSFLNNENSYISSVDEFKKTMLHVLNNYDQALIKSKKLRTEIARKYEIKSVVRNYQNLYYSLVP